MIDGKTFLISLLNDYTTGCLLDYIYLKKHYKMIVIDLSKQQVLHADSKEIQQIDFTGSLGVNGTMFFIIEEGKKTTLDFSQGTLGVIKIYFALI